VNNMIKINKIIKLLICMVVLCMSSCSQKDNNNNVLDAFKWLLGTWEFNSDNGMQYENWEKTNDTLFTGKSYQLVEGDTIVFEKIKLQLIDSVLYYVALVQNQNDNKEVQFRYLGKEEEKYIFENKEHDFPQQIIYQNKHKDTLLVLIKGISEGNEMNFELLMLRMK